MKKMATGTIIIILLLSATPFLFNNAQAVVTVGGSIATDTTWRQGNSYNLTSAVVVQSGTTLTIEPGVNVNLQNYNLIVHGTLAVKGSSNREVVFSSSNYWSQPSIQFTDTSTSWSDQTRSGCIIQNAAFQGVNIQISGNSPKISHNIFNQSGISITTGSPQITDNNFYSYGTTLAISSGGSASISNNYFKGTGYQYGVSIGGTSTFSNNILDLYWDGIAASGEATFKGNTVSNCYDIGISGQGSGVTISQNYVYNNKYGISGTGTIESNTIINNTVGIQVTMAQPVTLQYNIIRDNTNYDLMMAGAGTPAIDATNNYWGTTNTNSIGNMIYDYDDDANLGKVTYSPFLTQPSSNAPTVAGTIQNSGFINWITPLGFDDFESTILGITNIVVIVLAIGWVLIASLIIRKRTKNRRKNAKSL